VSTDLPTSRSAATASVVLAERILTHWRRHPLVPLQSLLLPALLLVTYHLMVSRSMVRLTGADNLGALVSMCTVAGAMMGSIGAGFQIPVDRDNGLLGRFWVQPVRRGSFLAAILLAEAARTAMAGSLILLLGMAFGLRFEGGWLAVIPFLLIPVALIAVFATIVTMVAVHPRSTSMLTVLGAVSIGMAFCTGGVAPVELFPGWLQPAIAVQPLTHVVDAMQALAGGELAGKSLLMSAAWLLGLAVLFAPLAARGYRRAAESGGCG